MARRASYIKQVRQAEGQILLLDAGDELLDPEANQSIDGKKVVRVARALGAMHYDAVAAGEAELLAAGLSENGWAEAIQTPILGANLQGGDGLLPHLPYISKVVSGVRVAVIGALSPEVASAAAIPDSGTQADPMSRALAEQLGQVRPEADLIVLLLHGTFEEGQALAAELEGVDVVIVGHRALLPRTSTRIGDTLLVQVGSEGKYVGRLKLRVSGPGRVAVLEDEQVLLKPTIPDDPIVASLLDLGNR